MVKDIPAGTVRRTIGYYYLIAYCPPQHVGELKKAASPLRRQVAKQAGESMKAYFAQAVPEVCWHIVAFHQNTREPDERWVDALADAARDADRSPAGAAAFQEEMMRVARLPQRARPENRLHRKRGCQLCAAPCGYGYFTLISDPRFELLQRALEIELEKPVAEQDPLQVLWEFTASHLAQTLGAPQGYTSPNHLGNLAYCLLTLATTKSRYPFPAAQMVALQEANQRLIQGLRTDDAQGVGG